MFSGESILASVLYTIFAVITTAGVFLITDHFKSRKMAIAGAVITVLLFGVLLAGLVHLIGTLDPQA